jgi:hypothetical protein
VPWHLSVLLTFSYERSSDPPSRIVFQLGHHNLILINCHFLADLVNLLLLLLNLHSHYVMPLAQRSVLESQSCELLCRIRTHWMGWAQVREPSLFKAYDASRSEAWAAV